MSQSTDPDDDQTRVTPTSSSDASTNDGAFAYLERDDDGPRSHEPTQPLPQGTYDTRPIPTQPAAPIPAPQDQWGAPPAATQYGTASQHTYGQPAPQPPAPPYPPAPQQAPAHQQAPWGVPPSGSTPAPYGALPQGAQPQWNPQSGAGQWGQPQGQWSSAAPQGQWAAQRGMSNPAQPNPAPDQQPGWPAAPSNAQPAWGQGAGPAANPAQPQQSAPWGTPTNDQPAWGQQPPVHGQWGGPGPGQPQANAPQWGQPPVVRQGWGQVPPAPMPAEQAADVDTTPTRAGRLAGWLTAALAAIAIAACLGTWAHASVSGGNLGEYDVTVNGFGYGSAHNTRGAYNIGVGGMTIGYVISVVAVLTIALAVLRGLGRLSRGPMWVAVGLMGLGGILSLVQLVALSVRFASVKRDLLDLSPTIHYSASSGWGLTLAIVATLAATAAAVVSAVKR